MFCRLVLGATPETAGGVPRKNAGVESASGPRGILALVTVAHRHPVQFRNVVCVSPVLPVNVPRSYVYKAAVHGVNRIYPPARRFRFLLVLHAVRALRTDVLRRSAGMGNVSGILRITGLVMDLFLPLVHFRLAPHAIRRMRASV